MKRLHTKSQNFLRSPSIVKTLVGHSNLKKTDLVYDIGAGSGIISSVLAERVSHVVTLEQDTRLIATLKNNLSEFDNVEIIHGDILTSSIPSVNYKIFANIPFHLSSPIIRRFTEADNPPRALYLIVQRQFAQKLLMDPGSFTGQLGAMIAPQFSARIRYKLRRTDYTPPPAVDTVFIELLRRDQPLVELADMPRYREFVQVCFSRQKFFSTLGMGEKKPSELTTEQWVSLFSKQSK